MLTTTQPAKHSNGKPERINDAQLLELHAQGLSTTQIAEHAGMSYSGINYRLKALQPTTSPPAEDNDTIGLQALREQVYYWQQHAATYRTRYQALRAALTAGTAA